MTDPVNGRELVIDLDLMTGLARALRSSRGIDSILEDALNIVCGALKMDAGAVFLYEDGVLRMRASHGLDPAPPGSVTLNLGEGVTGAAALQRTPIVVEDLREDPRVKFIHSIGDHRYLSMISVPMRDDDRLIGVLNVSVVGPRPFSNDEVKFTAFVAGQLVVAARSAQLYEEVVRGFREMSIINEVGQIINSVLDLNQLFDVVTRTCAEHIGARGCILRILDDDHEYLELKSIYGADPDRMRDRLLKVGEGIAGRVVRESRPIVSRNIADDPEMFDSTGLGIRSVICVPLMRMGQAIGTLGVFDKHGHGDAESVPFDDSDIGLVSTIGNQVSIAIENARLFNQIHRLSEEKDRKIGELNLLLEITNIMRSSLDLEETLYIMLTSVTMGQGLGFNRAALLLVDDDRGHLVGKMAVGPKSAGEANRFWHAVDTADKTLLEIVLAYGQFNMRADFEIDREIKYARIPLDQPSGLLARTVLEQRPFNITNYEVSPDSPEHILIDLGFTSFAVVPLVARDRVTGVIVVDNLVTRDPIHDEDVIFLELFANQAASAIEKARIYKNLELTNRRLVDARDALVRSKTLATLGEFSAGVAHELRNPLVSIGGFATRLQKKLDPDSREAHYARIIATEVERLEKILSQILEFVGGSQPLKRPVDVVLMIEEILLLFRDSLDRHNIRATTEFDERVRTIVVDEVQMRQLFINLVKNAIEAMRDGGELRVSSTLIETDGGVGFEVGDTGHGIPTEKLEHVFDPFFTTKIQGTGLGLSLCSRIIEKNHDGRIFIDSAVDRGTAVLVWLPASVRPDVPEKIEPRDNPD